MVFSPEAVLSQSFTFAVVFVFVGTNVGTNFWLAAWAEDSECLAPGETLSTKQRDYRLGVYGAMGLIQGSYRSLTIDHLVSNEVRP